MLVKELIKQLMDEDLDQEVFVSANGNFYIVDGIAQDCDSYHGRHNDCSYPTLLAIE